MKNYLLTDKEIKEECMQDSGIDLGRYGFKEMQQMQDAMRRYHQAKLKLLGISGVSVSFEEGYEKGYEKGWTEATTQACQEIAKNYHPNDR